MKLKKVFFTLQLKHHPALQDPLAYNDNVTNLANISEEPCIYSSLSSIVPPAGAALLDITKISPIAFTI